MPLPAYKIRLTLEGRFVGMGYYYRFVNDKLEIVTIPFDAPKVGPLTPFFYNKPIEDPDNPFFAPIGHKRDLEPRVGYYPLVIVEGIMYPPNHMYQPNAALIAAVNKGEAGSEAWETRFFPKDSLDPAVWQEALRLLKIR